jgi:TM2 domain-containing membrane protein YozV/cold shock CspA family protein
VGQALGVSNWYITLARPTGVRYMRGKIIAYNDTDGQGLISGDDGRRYPFVRGALGSELRVARPGQDVDFQVNGDQADAIYVIGGQTGQIGAKSKIAAGILALLLGGLGVHKFYIGANGAGVIMLLVFIVGLIFAGIQTLIVAIIELIEGIIYLTRSDEDFYETYEVGKKAWF